MMMKQRIIIFRFSDKDFVFAKLWVENDEPAAAKCWPKLIEFSWKGHCEATQFEMWLEHGVSVLRAVHHISRKTRESRTFGIHVLCSHRCCSFLFCADWTWRDKSSAVGLSRVSRTGCQEPLSKRPQKTTQRDSSSTSSVLRTHFKPSWPYSSNCVIYLSWNHQIIEIFTNNSSRGWPRGKLNLCGVNWTNGRRTGSTGRDKCVRTPGWVLQLLSPKDTAFFSKWSVDPAVASQMWVFLWRATPKTGITDFVISDFCVHRRGRKLLFDTHNTARNMSVEETGEIWAAANCSGSLNAKEVRVWWGVGSNSRTLLQRAEMFNECGRSVHLRALTHSASKPALPAC